jgi:hypothetical protein
MRKLVSTDFPGGVWRRVFSKIYEPFIKYCQYSAYLEYTVNISQFSARTYMYKIV